MLVLRLVLVLVLLLVLLLVPVFVPLLLLQLADRAPRPTQVAQLSSEVHPERHLSFQLDVDEENDEVEYQPRNIRVRNTRPPAAPCACCASCSPSARPPSGAARPPCPSPIPLSTASWSVS